MSDDFFDDDFFDDDGNLVETSWSRKARLEAEKNKKIQNSKEYKDNLKEANRRIAIEDRISQIEKQREIDRRKRKLKEEWMTMPKWVKSLPVTPLSAPPTEGKKEKALYALTKKVTLTDEERAKRETQAKRLKMAISDYNNIHREFPQGTPMVPVTVISLKEKSGGTTLSRCLSAITHQSRGDLGEVAVLDFSGPDSSLTHLYGSLGKGNPRKKVIMYHIVRTLSYLLETKPNLIDIFPTSDRGEFYLDNISAPEKRVKIDIKEVIDLYKLVRPTSGICYFDCDTSNIRALITSAIISHTVIFVVPLDKKTSSNMGALLEEMKESMKPEDYQEMLDNALIVFSASHSKMMYKENVAKIRKFVTGIKDKYGFKQDVKIIPFDPALKNLPFNIDRVKFSTGHVLREIVSYIIDRAIEKGK